MEFTGRQNSNFIPTTTTSFICMTITNTVLQKQKKNSWVGVAGDVKNSLFSHNSAQGKTKSTPPISLLETKFLARIRYRFFGGRGEGVISHFIADFFKLKLQITDPRNSETLTAFIWAVTLYVSIRSQNLNCDGSNHGKGEAVTIRFISYYNRTWGLSWRKVNFLSIK